jgi:hypothetical protein
VGKLAKSLSDRAVAVNLPASIAGLEGCQRGPVRYSRQLDIPTYRFMKLSTLVDLINESRSQKCIGMIGYTSTAVPVVY